MSPRSVADRSLPAWLERIEQLHPREIDLGLDRVAKVASALGWPAGHRFAGRIITVGGTNGKGTCVHVLRELVLAAGLSVLAYTSPHLVRYNERVVLNDRPVSDRALCDAFTAVDAARGTVPLTYFEFGTLAALWICAMEHPDLLLLEVGMGGRLDAVNVVDADFAVVTGVALDHQEWLGSDREAIGREKAGIFRTGRPAVCGDRNPPESLLAHAREVGCPLYRAGDAFDWEDVPVGAPWRWRGCGREGQSIELDLPGTPYLPRAPWAAALQVLSLCGLSPGDCSTIRPLPGRFQRFDWQNREVILDVAHNPQAAAALAEALRAGATAPETVAVLGLLAGRDALEIVQPLRGLVDRWLSVSTSGPRGYSSDSLSRILAAGGLMSEPVETAQQALCLAAQRTPPGSRILVFGSFQLPGELLTPDLNELRDIQPWTG